MIVLAVPGDGLPGVAVVVRKLTVTVFAGLGEVLTEAGEKFGQEKMHFVLTGITG